MKNKYLLIILPLFAIFTYFLITPATIKADKASCDAYIYIANNSLFEITLTIDGFPSGRLLVGKSKTYTVSLINNEPKKIKVKVEYQDPDYIEPKSINYVTKNKVECGATDTIYVAFSK